MSNKVTERRKEEFERAIEAAHRSPSGWVKATVGGRTYFGERFALTIAVSKDGRVAHHASGPGWREQSWARGEGPGEFARALTSGRVRLTRPLQWIPSLPLD